MTAAQLQRIRDLQAERGHTKYRLEDGYHRVCLLGAHNLVVTGSPLGWAHTGEFARALGFRNSQAVADWNNQEHITEADVLRLLDTAIERLHAHERQFDTASFDAARASWDGPVADPMLVVA